MQLAHPELEHAKETGHSSSKVGHQFCVVIVIVIVMGELLSSQGRGGACNEHRITLVTSRVDQFVAGS